MKKTILSILLLLTPGLLRAVVPAPEFFTQPAAHASAGGALALNERYVLRGAPEATVNGFANAGEVEVFDARSRQLLRVLRLPKPGAGERLGSALALAGSTAFVGAPGTSKMSGPEAGAVHAFDVRSGKRLWSYYNQTPQEKLGGAGLALFGSYLAVGVPQGRLAGTPAKSGYVRLLHRANGNLFTHIAKPNPVADDFMGQALAAAGTTLAIGIPGDDTAWNNAGAVMLARLHSTEPFSLIPNINGGHMGRSVAIQGDRLLAGGDDNWVQVFSVSTRQHLRSLSVGMNVEDAHFGRALALCGGYAVVSANGMFSSEGLAHFFNLNSPQTTPEVSLAFNQMRHVFAVWEDRLLVADKVATPKIYDYNGVHQGWKTGLEERAKAGPNSDIGTLLQDGAINGQGKALFGLVLGGQGNKGPALRLAYSTLGNDPGAAVIAGDAFGAQTIRRHESLMVNGSARGLLSVRLAPSGALAVLEDNGSTVSSLVMEGSMAVGGATLARIHAFNQPTQSTDSPTLVQRITTLASLKRGSGDATASNDSLICTPGAFAIQVPQVREGQASALDSFRIGQLSPRFARVGDRIVFHSALIGDNGQIHRGAVQSRTLGGGYALLARQGEIAPDAEGAVFSSFLGECVNLPGKTLFRARLKGAPAARNEGLWSDRNGTLKLVLRKGDLDSHSLRPFVSFRRFFLLNDHSVVVWARLGGRGVNASNDGGLWLIRQNASAPELILRESHLADSCGEARIGTIQRVDVDAAGHLVVLASLAGASASKNQVLMTGIVGSGSKHLDFLKTQLRKGTRIARDGGQWVRGFSLGNHTADALGAASKGIAKITGANGCLFTVAFDGGERVLMSGKP